MADKAMKVVTREVIAVGDYHRNREVVQMCVDWLTEQMQAIGWDKLGISFALNDAPNIFEGDRPSFSIDVTGPKQYLGIDWMKNLENRCDGFVMGVRKAWSINERGD